MNAEVRMYEGLFSDAHRDADVRRFPYSAVYTLDAEITLVLAVAHQHRKPGYWRNRALTNP